MKSIHIILLDDEGEVTRIEEKFTEDQVAVNAFADLSADLESMGREGHGDNKVRV